MKRNLNRCMSVLEICGILCLLLGPVRARPEFEDSLVAIAECDQMTSKLELNILRNPRNYDRDFVLKFLKRDLFSERFRKHPDRYSRCLLVLGTSEGRLSINQYWIRDGKVKIDQDESVTLDAFLTSIGLAGKLRDEGRQKKQASPR